MVRSKNQTPTLPTIQVLIAPLASAASMSLFGLPEEASHERLIFPTSPDGLRAPSPSKTPSAVQRSAAHAYGNTGNDADVMVEVGLIGVCVLKLFDRMRNGISHSRVAELWARKKPGMA